MTQALHSQARTTHLIREEIRASMLSQAALARLYNVTQQTIRKWLDRESPVDQHSSTRVEASNTDSGSQELAAKKARFVRETRI